ncbi:MAG: hypothetical protein IT191_02140 [Microbacteriaceae bacterium]|nr:hypothetical protein [Microbacteriaceae bacterium]
MPNFAKRNKPLVVLGALALTFAGVTGISTPAMAADLGSVSTEAQLVTAINTANSTPGADSFTLTGTGFTLTADLPQITDALTITGPSSATFWIYADGYDAFNIASTAATASLSGFTLDGAGTNNSTFGIDSTGVALTVSDVVVTDSYAGLNVNGGSVQVSQSTFKNNDDLGTYISLSSATPASSLDQVHFLSNSSVGAQFDLSGTSSLTVSQSEALSNGYVGFQASQYDFSELTFTNTNSELNGYSGFELDAEDDATLTLTNTTASSNDGYGLELDTDNRVVVTITTITANSNLDDGIQSDTEKHGSLTMTNIVASDNDGDGVDLEAYLGNVVTATNITANDNSSDGVELGAHNDGSIVSMTNVTSTGNENGANFNEIEHGGDATLTNATLTGNDERGILIDDDSVDGTDSIITIKGVTSSGNGGGTLNGAGLTLVQSHNLTVNVSDSTFSGNNADRGAGIYSRLGNNDPATLSIINSTISGNSANTGGAIYVQSGAGGSFDLLSSTVANNSTPIGGGSPEDAAVYLQGATTTIHNTIIAGNTQSDLDISQGTALSIDYSLIQTRGADPGVSTAISSGSGNISGVSAGLGPLGMNGGTTATHLLLDSSPALNSGDPGGAGLITTDQRGLARIVGIIDMGAVEMAPALADTGANPTLPLLGGALVFGLGFLLLFETRRRRAKLS